MLATELSKLVSLLTSLEQANQFEECYFPSQIAFY